MYHSICKHCFLSLLLDHRILGSYSATLLVIDNTISGDNGGSISSEARAMHRDAMSSTCQSSMNVLVYFQHSFYTTHNLTDGTSKQVSLGVSLFENEGKEMQNKIKLTRIIHILIPYYMLTIAYKLLADIISQNTHSNVP